MKRENTMHPFEITMKIATAMDRIHERNHVYDPELYKKIETAVGILQTRGHNFDSVVIEAVANGEMTALSKKSPKGAKKLSALLDQLYENNKPEE